MIESDEVKLVKAKVLIEGAIRALDEINLPHRAKIRNSIKHLVCQVGQIQNFYQELLEEKENNDG